MPVLRYTLILLLAVTLGGAPLAQSLGAPGSAECVVQQADLSDDACCGGAAPASGCAVCATGCVLFMPSAVLGNSTHYRFSSPSMRPLFAPASGERAPDTAPPKSSFA